jgi:hypothetical protein
MTIIETRLTNPGLYYPAYRDAFRPLRKKAAQRHVMTSAEFRGVMADTAIRKFIAVDGNDFLGMSCITNDLHAWPLIEPEFFANRFPMEAMRNDIWYIGFAFAVPGVRQPVLPDLLKAMYPLSCGGISIMDFCTFNVDRKLPNYVKSILKDVNPLVGMHLEDAQEFWAIDFRGVE